MEIQPLNEAIQEVRSEASSKTAVPGSRRHVVLSVLAIVISFVALLAFIELILIYHSHDHMSPLRYFGSLGGLVVALLALIYVLTREVRFDEAGKVSVQYNARIDLLERKNKYLEDMLELVADQQPGSIMVFDRHNKFFFVNEGASKRLGKQSVEVIGHPPSKVMPNALAQKLEIRLASARATNEPVDVLDKVVDDKGLLRFIQSHFEQVKKQGAMNGCVSVRESDLTSLVVERERREQMLRQVIETLVAVVDRRDPYATGHSVRVGRLAKEVALMMSLEPSYVEAAEIAGSLMNFGKVLISRQILTKTTPLTPDELQRIRDSILTSADILEIINFEGPVVPTLRQVLEKVDGTGAPDGLKGEQIMISARIVAACNAFVAFVSPRAHRPGMSFDEALNILAQESGKAYDESVLVAMSKYIDAHKQDLEWLRGGSAMIANAG